MIDKTITHDEARENTLYLHGKYDEAYNTLNDYITQQEQFAKDVARYFEILRTDQTSLEEYNEWCKLRNKLTKEVAK